jgi:cytidylate kinase
MNDMSNKKKSIITIAGSLGSGKSSTGKALAQTLGFEHFSSGDLFRKMAAERGVSIEAINQTAEIQKDLDGLVDAWLRDLYQSKDNFVVDSRMAWHWMPDSFKVFLALDQDTSAERIYNHVKMEQRVSEEAQSVADVRASIQRRFASEQKRYFDLYQVNPTDSLNFDIVLTTKRNDLKTVTAIARAAYGAWRNA